jgi:hypothetical protein
MSGEKSIKEEQEELALEMLKRFNEFLDCVLEKSRTNENFEN